MRTRFNECGQINCRIGKEASDEQIADAKAALQVRWRNDSPITVPVWR